MQSDFLLDPHIRLWVFLPIILITFFLEIIRHYLTIIFAPNKDLTLDQIKDMQTEKRFKILQENYVHIPKKAFEMRRQQNPYLLRKSGSGTQNNFLLPQNQMKMLNHFKEQSANMIPMIIVGTWVNYAFYGFITTKVPFPLTYAFRSMLQKDIELIYLDPSWVSSISWYFLNVVGLRNLCSLIFGYNYEICEVDGSDLFERHENVFNNNWETLEAIEHNFQI